MKFFSFSAFALLLSFIVSTGFGQVELQQITTLGTGAAVGSLPQTFFALEDQLFFVAESKHLGRELWKTDGTEAGTMLVKDINLGAASSSISNFVQYKGKVYFTANDNIKSQQLWVTDGTPTGTFPVTTTLGTGITHVVADGNYIYLLRKSLDNLQLWKSDGSLSGTVLVKGDIKISNQPANLTVAGGLVYFSCQPVGKNSSHVWRSDGTADGTFPITESIDGNGSGPNGTAQPTQFMEYNGALYFIARGPFSPNYSGLMKSDGTVAGTVAVMSLQGGLVSYGQGFTYNGKMYFTFFETDNYRFIIAESDGTAAKTSIIFDIGFAKYFSPSEIVARDGFLYLTLGDGVDGTGLYKLNLTTRLHQMLKSVGGPMNRPGLFVPDMDLNSSATTTGKIFFQSKFNSPIVSTLWVTEGTAATTVKLLDNQTSCPMIQFKDKIYFRRISDLGSELWTSDGTVTGTYMVKDINTTVSGLTNTPLITNGAQTIFAVRDAVAGIEPFVTDGTVEGTRRLKNLTAGAASGFAYNVIEINGMLVFAAIDTNGKMQFFRSDGTEGGTTPITSFTEVKTGPIIVRHSDGKRCFFHVTNPGFTSSLFISDGTPAGTQELMNFGMSMYGYGFKLEKMAMGTDRLYFSLSNEGEDLWMSNGTVAGTVKVADMVDMNELTAVGDKVYFVGQPGTEASEVEVFVSDGTAAGTKMIKDINGSKSSGAMGLTPFNDRVVFAATDDATGREMWISDGTEAGTTLVKDVFPGSEGSIYNSEFGVFQDHVYFVAGDGVHGTELWRTSGTPESTTLFKDIVPGEGSSLPASFKSLNDKLYFQAYTPEHGFEVWSTDGSVDNTKLLVDVIPGPEYSNPFGFIDVNDKLVFYADTQSNGVQLWSYTTNSKVTGVEDLEAGFSIYPNPSTGIYRIRLNDSFAKDAQVQVFSIDGRAIAGAMMDNDGRLNLGNSPAGVYVIKIKVGNQRIVRRVVKF